jgi:hypothetical protein
MKQGYWLCTYWWIHLLLLVTRWRGGIIRRVNNRPLVLVLMLVLVIVLVLGLALDWVL